MNKSNNGKYLGYTIKLLIILIIVLILWVLLVTNFSWIEIADENNEIGDAIGGITNPIIGIGGIILTFLAFYIQYEFNREQSKVIIDQKNESNFNFLLSEFARLEKKIFDTSKECDTINDIMDEDSLNITSLHNKLNYINYSMISYNILLEVLNVEKIQSELTENKIKLDEKNKLLLNNLNSLFLIYFEDSLKHVSQYLKGLVDTKWLDENELRYLEFLFKYKELKNNIQKIQRILKEDRKKLNIPKSI